MKNLTIIEAGRIGLSDEILAFEQKHSLKLPSQFKQFLLSQNPYLVEEGLYVKGTSEFWVQHFFPLDSEMELNLQDGYEELIDYFGQKYLLFADDSGGWFYVLSLVPGENGRVYFCRMDEALEDALTPLSSSFEEFIDGLEVEGE